MKFLLLLIIAVGMCTISCTPKYLDGLYLTPQQDGLYADGKKGGIDSDESGSDNYLVLKERRYHLKMKTVYSKGFLKIWRRNKRSYLFRFVYKTADSFMVRPASKAARQFFGNRDSLAFKAKAYYNDPTFYFKRLVFHSSTCFGTCHELHMSVDRLGNIRLRDNGSRTDTGCNKNFTGKLAPENLDRLHKILRRSQIATLHWPGADCCDLPLKNLRIYYNDTCNYQQAMFIPYVSDELIWFLYTFVADYNILKQVPETLEFEE